MIFKNKPAVNDPDLSRPSSLVVDQARALLAPQKRKSLLLLQLAAYGLGLLLCSFLILHLAFAIAEDVASIFQKITSGNWHWRWQS